MSVPVTSFCLMGLSDVQIIISSDSSKNTKRKESESPHSQSCLFFQLADLSSLRTTYSLLLLVIPRLGAPFLSKARE